MPSLAAELNDLGVSDQGIHAQILQHKHSASSCVYTGNKEELRLRLLECLAAEQAGEIPAKAADHGDDLPHQEATVLEQHDSPDQPDQVKLQPDLNSQLTLLKRRGEGSLTCSAINGPAGSDCLTTQLYQG